MEIRETELRKIYLDKISEALSRLQAAEIFLNEYHKSEDIFIFEAAVLQMRKALECVALAAIAPNQKAYADFRAKAENQADYTKDFNAKKILKMLSKINPDFYPIPVSLPVKTGIRTWRFEKRVDASLKKKRFETFYDRLGKFLHADNPWGNKKGQQNLLNEIPEVIGAVRLLLFRHSTKVRTPDFNGTWIVEASSNVYPPQIIVGQAINETSPSIEH